MSAIIACERVGHFETHLGFTCTYIEGECEHFDFIVLKAGKYHDHSMQVCNKHDMFFEVLYRVSISHLTIRMTIMLILPGLCDQLTRVYIGFKSQGN